MEKVEGVFKYNNIQGGSFSAWCQLSNSKKQSQKLYLVIVPRRPTLNRKRETGKFFLTTYPIRRILAYTHVLLFINSISCHYR